MDRPIAGGRSMILSPSEPLRGTPFTSPATLARLGSGVAVGFGPTGAQFAHLQDGRLHLNHGPIDLIVQIWGDPAAVAMAKSRLKARFDHVLRELCAELPELRQWRGRPKGPIAAKMSAAVLPFESTFITPMAAVAGAVAEDVLGQLALPGIERAYVNNGGDIAIHLTPGQGVTCAISNAMDPSGRIRIEAEDPVRGIATSGWGGRSFSLGIADAVTVLAKTASMADAAATVIANAVDMPDHPAIARRRATDLLPDSDLGERLVTIGVGALTLNERKDAIAKGAEEARRLISQGLIEGAALYLQGEVEVVGRLAVIKTEKGHG